MATIESKLKGFGPTSSAAVLLILLPFVSVLLWKVWQDLNSPLRRYPGPFLARWTGLYRFYYVIKGESHLFDQKLHQKYGPIVRIAPNVLDLDIPDLIKTIYNFGGDWKKTEFYHGSSAKVEGKIIYNMFSQTNPELHAREKRPIAKYYTMNGVLPLEPHIDVMINYFGQRLEEEFMDGANAGKTCDLGRWLLYYAWDVVGEVTFSQPIGYLEKGFDFDKTLWASEQALDYFTWVGQYPFLDYFFDKNPVRRFGPPGFGTITGISVKHLIDRYQGNDKSYHDAAKPDYLDKFIEAKKLHPDVVDDGQIISYLMINMIAGADTTAITIRAVFYYGLKNPDVWAKLEKEVLAAGLGDVAAFKSSISIPYLDAVIREAMRIHPGVGMTLLRYVPKTGLNLPDGSFVPPGAVVGMNPYITGRSPEIWGDDPDAFRPERWLRAEDQGESQEDFEKRLRKMNNLDLAFGAGSRICIGKNLGLLEVYKVIATLITLYKIELAHPDRDWKVINGWFLRQEGLEVKMSRRHPK